jgi:tRNA dimethylallyltransferase
MDTGLPKIVAVIGPTSSGKSDLAVAIACRAHGEVISADSRQVYRGMDIGTGKVTKKEMRGIPHHLLDIASPKRTYTVAHWKRDAERAIADIGKRGKLPVICGGTGFYVQSVTDGLVLPDVKPNTQLRAELVRHTPEELFTRLQHKDPERAETIDAKNPVRLIRALEITDALGKVPPLHTTPKFNTLFIGIKTDPDVLHERIHARLLKRMRRGMLGEVKRLHEEGVSWRRMEELGLEYRFLARHLQGKLSKEDMLAQLEIAIVHYAKRQVTWWKKDARIHWVAHDDIEGVIQIVNKWTAKEIPPHKEAE